jgi:hypothetical protein
VVNGDVVLDTFDALSYQVGLGELYLSVYILLFTYVVLMTIIAIVEEAFFAVSVPAENLTPQTGPGRQLHNDQARKRNSVYAVCDALL